MDKPDSQLILNSLVNSHSGKTITGVQYGGLKPNIDIPILAKRYLDKVRSIYLVQWKFYHIVVLDHLIQNGISP